MRSAFAAFLFCAATLADAQPFPSKPLHLIVPFPPGGGNDTVARAIGKAAACILRCHVRQADGRFLDGFEEEDCEFYEPCGEAYGISMLGVDSICPTCLDAAARGALFRMLESFLDSSTNGAIYCECASTTTSTTTTSLP